MHEWHAKTRPELPPYTSSPDLILQIRPDPNARMYRTQAQRIWRAEARAKVLYFFNTLSFETEEYTHARTRTATYVHARIQRASRI